MTSTMQAVAQASWTRAFIAIAGGVSIAAQHGKIPAAISVLRDEMGLSLTEVGALASMLPLGTAICGAIGAQLASWIGIRRSAVIGLYLCAAGSLAGSAADGFWFLFATRIVEGIGYLLAVVSLPTLVSLSAGSKNRPLAMGIWAAYIPAGITLALLAGAVIIERWGWQGLWVAIGSLPAIVATLILVPGWREDYAEAESHLGWLLRQPVAWLLTASFFLFSFQFIGVGSFLPAMLEDTSDLGLVEVNAYVAGFIALNILGNPIGGRLVGAGWSLRACFTLALATMALSLTLLHLSDLPLGLRVAAGCVYGLFSGIMPGSIWAFMPSVFEHGKRTTALTGLVMQGAAIAQFVGPVTVGLVVDLSGKWSSVGILVCIASLIGIVLSWSAAPLRRSGRAKGQKNSEGGLT